MHFFNKSTFKVNLLLRQWLVKLFMVKRCFHTGESWKPILYSNTFKCVHKATQETLISFFSPYTHFHVLDKQNSSGSGHVCYVQQNVFFKGIALISTNFTLSLNSLISKRDGGRSQPIFSPMVTILVWNLEENQFGHF